MLIVCPSCATSYMVDQASLGPAGRTVRCARCKTTWHAGGPQADVDAFVDRVIAEAEARDGGAPAPPGKTETTAPARPAAAHLDDDFGDEASEPIAGASAQPTLPRIDAFEIGHDEPPAHPIDDAPPLVPPLEQAPLVEAAAGEQEDIETFAARRQRLQSKRKSARRSSRWTAIVLVLVAFNVAVVGARNEVVRFLPQTAGLFAAIGLPVNLRQLKFDAVHIARETEHGVPILVVEGVIVSEASKPVEVPRLRFAARNAAGQEVYTWTMPPDRKMLRPGEKLAFRSRLASPPNDAKDVMVRFFTTGDAMPGGK
jgi:predicted Zn finger-like uncharacterized protein